MPLQPPSPIASSPNNKTYDHYYFWHYNGTDCKEFMWRERPNPYPHDLNVCLQDVQVRNVYNKSTNYVDICLPCDGECKPYKPMDTCIKIDGAGIYESYILRLWTNVTDEE